MTPNRSRYTLTLMEILTNLTKVVDRKALFRAEGLSCPECGCDVNLIETATSDNLVSLVSTRAGMEPVIDPRTMFVACAGCEWAVELSELIGNN